MKTSSDKITTHYNFMNGSYNRNSGGVVGYLTRLKEGLNLNNPDNIQIITYSSKTILHDRIKIKYFIFTLLKLLLKIIGFSGGDIKILLWKYDEVASTQKIQINFNTVKSIHVQGSYNFYSIYSLIKKSKKNIITLLTVHDPIPLPEIYLQNGFIKKKIVYKIACQRELFAYKNSDILIFPCKESLEGYYKHWPFLKTLFKDKDIRYIITGNSVNPNVQNIRSKYNLSQNDFICSYVGNYIPTKGITVIIDAAKILWEQGYNIYFLTAGSNNTKLIPPPKDHRWIYEGKVSNPQDYMYSSDVYISATIDCYFDLVNIESLGLGIPLIVSNVGGNKWFIGKSTGITTFENQNPMELAQAILKIYTLKQNKENDILDAMKKNNINLYKTNMTDEIFANNYTKLIRQIYLDYNISK